ncbi:unnamed protein product [Choristocarpus tenellus]
MPPHVDAIKQHLSSKKLKKQKEWYNADFSAYEPYITPHKRKPKLLFCHLTETELNRIPSQVEAHVKGKKFQRRKREREERTNGDRGKGGHGSGREEDFWVRESDHEEEMEEDADIAMSEEEEEEEEEEEGGSEEDEKEGGARRSPKENVIPEKKGISKKGKSGGGMGETNKHKSTAFDTTAKSREGMKGVTKANQVAGLGVVGDRISKTEAKDKSKSKSKSKSKNRNKSNATGKWEVKDVKISGLGLGVGNNTKGEPDKSSGEAPISKVQVQKTDETVGDSKVVSNGKSDANSKIKSKKTNKFKGGPSGAVSGSPVVDEASGLPAVVFESGQVQTDKAKGRKKKKSKNGIGKVQGVAQGGALEEINPVPKDTEGAIRREKRSGGGSRKKVYGLRFVK